MTRRILSATVSSAAIAYLGLSALGCLWTTAASADDISGTYVGSNGSPTTSGGLADNGNPGIYSLYGSNSVSSGSFTGGNGGDSSGGGADSLNQGGDGGNGINVYYGGTLDVTGGTFTGGNGGNASGGSETSDYGGFGGYGLAIYSGTVADITGGTFIGGNGGNDVGEETPGGGGAGGSGLLAYGSTATVSGGSFTGGSAGSPDAPAGFSFYAYESGVITLVGTFIDAPSSPITTNGVGTLTAQLADNDSFETYTYGIYEGTIVLEAPAVPEPASIGVLAVASVGLLTRRRRRSN